MTVPVRRLPEDAVTALDVVDLAVGVIAVAATVTGATVRRLRVRRLLGAGARPVLRIGAVWRHRLLHDIDDLLPELVDAAMRRMEPTELVRRYVDLDDLVAGVDLDAVAARLDVEAVIQRVDLDAIASRLDVEAVIQRVDLDAVAARIDINAVLDRLDLTQTVLQRVDMRAVVDGVLAQIDLAVLVEGVLDEIDLPEIIRESTGTMASETVRSVRMQGVSADEAVSRVVDRLLLRHSRPATGGAV